MGTVALVLTCVIALLFLRRFASLDISNFALTSRAILLIARAAGIAFIAGSVALLSAYYLTPYLGLAGANFILLAQLAAPLTFIILLLFSILKLFKK